VLFPFSPPNHLPANELFVQIHSGLSPAELDAICDFGEGLDKTNVKLYGRFDDKAVKATGSHFPLALETQLLYVKMAELFRQINEQNWQFDLSGFFENFYYMDYGPTDHFGWHVDAGPKTPAPRKLSGILQLSDPTDYDGGEFEVGWVQREFKTVKQRGMVTFFPSGVKHRVTHVFSGRRKALTMFAAGPNLR